MCLDRNFDEDQQTLLVLKKSLKLLKENVEECTEDLEKAKTYFIEAFIALMGGTEGIKQVSFPFQMRTKNQIPWNLIRFTQDVWSGGSYEHYPIHEMNSSFFDLMMNLDGNGNALAGTQIISHIIKIFENLIESKPDITQEGKDTLEVFKRYFGWFYDELIINDILARIGDVGVNDGLKSFPILRVFQVAGEYFPYMTGWTLAESPHPNTDRIKQNNKPTILESFAWVAEKIRNKLSHRQIGMLDQGFNFDPLIQTRIFTELQRLKDALVEAQTFRRESIEDVRCPLPYDKTAFLVQSTYTLRQKFNRTKIKEQEQGLIELLDEMSEKTNHNQLLPKKITSALTPTRKDFISKEFFPDSICLEATDMQINDRRAAFVSLLRTKQNFTEEYAGAPEYVELIRNIRKNTGAIFQNTETYYWQDEAGYLERLFFEKINMPLLSAIE